MKDFFKYLLATVVGLILTGILAIFILTGLVSALIYFSDKTVEVKDNSLLLIRLEDRITERSDNNPLNEISFPGIPRASTIGLDAILSSIEKAKTDNRISGIYLNPTVIQAGYGTVEEIRKALESFKESGKFIYAYGETLSQKAYYLASVADKLVLNPQGIMEFQGLTVQRRFYKRALEKLGVEVQVIRHGKFKAAVEPYVMEEMSEENRLQTETYAKKLWNQVLTDISNSRDIPVDVLNSLADEILTLRKGSYLVEKRMVDTLLYKDEVLSELKVLTGVDEDSDLKAVDLRRYARMPAKTDGKGLAKDKIAVIYATGNIDMGGESPNAIDSEELSRTIRKARRDSSIKAIVLRINSPGGSAYGSEVIWREVKLAAERKPVVASLGDIAASGGYYIAAAADTIIADRTALTGSIGIFATIPNLGKLLNEKLGITYDVVNTNRNSNFISYNRPMTKFEQALMQQFIEEGYDTFIDRVARGRNLSKAQVDSIGQGRVWDAESALKIGLIDLCGGINDAIELAAGMSGLERYRVEQLPALKDPFTLWMKELSDNAQSRAIQKELGTHYEVFRELKETARFGGVMARIPCNITVE